MDILAVAARLKIGTRHCFTAPDRKESIADHSWRVALTAMLLSREDAFAGYNMNRVIRMCLIHDLGEAFTGDIPSFEKCAGQEAAEAQAFDRWVATFPAPQREEWQSLLAEMTAQETPESKLYQALDKLEAVISHDESDLLTWLPLEFDLQLTYGQEQAAFSPYLREWKAAIDELTRKKIDAFRNRSLS